jgi:hypothetical protein
LGLKAEHKRHALSIMFRPSPVTQMQRSTWTRRSKTIPAMLGATVAGAVLSPIITVGLAAVDLSKRRIKMPSVRTFWFALQYGIND